MPSDNNYCLDCGKAIGQSAKRCNSCAAKARWAQGTSYGTLEWRAKMSRGVKAAWARGDFDGIFTSETMERRSERIKAAWARGCYANRSTEEVRKRMSISTKAAWARGCFDGVFNSPTKPEGIIKAFLDDRGIEYEFQFRLGSFYYDFYLLGRNLLIEYDNAYWHSSPRAKERDEEKTKLAMESGYMLARMQSNLEDKGSLGFCLQWILGE